MKKLTYLVAFATFLSNAMAQWQWVNTPASAPQDEIGNSAINSISSTISGITYAAGYFIQAADFGNFSLVAKNFKDPFLMKCDTNGNIIWIFNLRTSQQGSANSLAIDKDENIYVAGTFSGSIEFSPNVSAQSAKPDSFFLAKYNKHGVLLWARTADALTPNGVAVDSAGNPFVTGSFKDSQKLDSITLQSSGNHDIFVARYNASGDLIWAQNAGTAGYDVGNAIAVDSNGDVLITGAVAKGMVSFGRQTLDNTNGNWLSAYLTKYSSDGSVLWSRIESSKFPDVAKTSYGYGVACDASNNYYITGSFNLDMNFKIQLGGFLSSELKANADKDIFVAAYYSNGFLKWTKKAGSSTSGANAALNLTDDEALSITIDKSGNNQLLITGYFESDCTFDNIQVLNTGDKDIFVAAYDCQNGTVQYVKNVGTTVEDVLKTSCWGKSISTDAANNFYLGGRFNTSWGLEMKFGNILLSSNEGIVDAYLAKHHNSTVVIPRPKTPVLSLPK